MSSIPLEQSLLLSGVLFLLGLAGVCARRNLVFILISIEIMLNASALAFIAAGAHHRSLDGQVFFFFILAMSAAEVSVGLALTLQLFRRFQTLDADQISEMCG